MELSRRIADLAEACGGTIAVAALHLPTGQRLDREAERSFPAASVIKLPILAALYSEAEAGQLRWEETVVLTEEAKVPGDGALRELHTGAALTLEDLARLMIVISDNTATNLLIDRIGVDTVNDLLAREGCSVTRLGRRMYDFAARERGLENHCSAGEMTGLLAHLARRELISAAASEAMLAILKRQQRDSRIPRLLPPETPVANKTGSISGVCHDVGLIDAPGGPIALSVLTKGARDHYTAEETIGRIARAVFDTWVENEGVLGEANG